MATVTLLESGGRQKVTGGTGMTALSVLLHGTLIGAAVLYTLHAGIQGVHAQLEHKVVFVVPPPDAPKPVVKPQEAPPRPVVKSQDKRVFVPPKLEAPPLAIPAITTIPTTIAPPRVDIPASVFDTLGKGVAQAGPGGHGDNAAGGVDNGNQVFTAATVDLEARTDPRHTVSPQYPISLQSAGIEGRVVAQFVVDQDGTVDMGTFKVLSSTNDQFTAAVKASLRRTRYIPAQSGGKTVRQLVQQPFDFNLGHNP